MSLEQQTHLRAFAQRLIVLFDEHMQWYNPQWYTVWQAQISAVKHLHIVYTGAFCYIQFTEKETSQAEALFPTYFDGYYAEDGFHSCAYLYYEGLEDDLGVCAEFGDIFGQATLWFRRGVLLHINVVAYFNTNKQFIPNDIEKLSVYKD
ncbi:hypothetical protein [Entomospira culicis]|uniref:hypothetical protein n=1 Tax=Entomospira culicis TaxID=2719989 RepID=UPI002368CFCC|nr:hypothetical protein [Entomospira culicis]